MIRNALPTSLKSRLAQWRNPQFQLRPIEPGKGLMRLLKPADGDLFFDMEGDPLIENRLEYLFGVYSEGKDVKAIDVARGVMEDRSLG